MKIQLNKQLILENIHRSSNLVYSKMEALKKSNKLLDDLTKFIIKNNIPKEDILLFGSIVLGIQGLRVPNDLDIGIRKDQITKLKNKYPSATGSYGAQYDINELSFIHEDALPKLNNESLFDLNLDTFKGFKIITFDQWKQMQKNDPLKKDKQFLSELSNLYQEKETRFLIEFDDKKFNDIPEKVKALRTDWYFDNYRIRFYNNDKLKKHGWFKITGQGTVMKTTEKIPNQDINKLDKNCSIKLEMVSKYPIVDGKEVFFEKVTATKNNKEYIFYSSEAETREHLENIKAINKLNGFKKITNYGYINLKDLAEKVIRK